MSWLPLREAYPALGVTEGAFKYAVKRGDIRYKPDPQYTKQPRRLYWCGDGDPPEDNSPNPLAESLSSADQGDSQRPTCLDLEGDWIEREGYAYDGQRRAYVLNVSTQRAPLVLRRERVEAIWAKYAGDQATVAEVCREFALSKTLFGEIKRCLGLTKTRAPWTDETLDETPADDLIADALRAKERAVLGKVEREEWRRIKKVAEQKRFLRAVVQDALGAGQIAPPRIPTRLHPSSDRALVVGWTDIHIGKRPHGSQGSLDQQRDELLSLIADVAERARACGPLRAIYVPIGSDLLHADNAALTTTRGTPQGSQSVGSIRQHLRLAISLTAALIDTLAGIAPVVAFSLPGNHDETLTDAVAFALEERYRMVDQVAVDTTERRRKTFAFGSVPLIFSHGDKIKSTDIPMLVATECPQGCNVRRSVVFRGHIHTASSSRRSVSDGHSEVGGFDVVQMASPSPPDDWHHENLYDLSSRRLTLALISEGCGLDSVQWARAEAA